ncbi:4'-phosphopantetheinyl transferase family protein [Janthinobacterium sp. 1_2014MBL_MicDiv]|uniref:4'-phosphopantetheinyl transferase family protein n=1 Tax=Janthinobacterium sp. 1_2014MBL_MicDiv TaxID=1644131 RepID=UPI0012EC1667|nr:4'-phosphopantetheinyl transferase superfamily protein [Janthinobacterium sp. 1_2014MBL_MicDiv]
MISHAQDVRVRRWSMAVHGHGALSVFLTRVEQGLFDAAWFASEALDCPPQIAASVPRRQAEFFHGRLCARAALLQHGLSCGDVPIGRSREPLWPPGIIGSITHNQVLAAATVLPLGPYRGAGIDIESVMTAESWRGMIDIVLSDAEIVRMRAMAHAAPFSVLMALVFSAKESFYKAMFSTVKRFLDFNTIVLTDIDTRQRTLSFRIADPLCAQLQGSEHCQIAYAIIDERTVCTAFIW